VEHISDDELERYAMGTLSESGCATVEEHLLACPQCQDRLESIERYVAAMRSAAAKIRMGPENGCEKTD
jgi:anti-sigma factor RsiW